MVSTIAVADALAHEAGAALAFVQAAVARAQVALDAAVVEQVPVAGRVGRGCGLASGAFIRALCGKSGSRPLGDGVARQAHALGPEIGRQPGLALQLREERRADRAICSHTCGRNVPRLLAVLQDHARRCPGAATRSPPPRCRSRSARGAMSSDTSMRVVRELGGGERLEARIEKCRGLGVGLDVVQQLAVRLQGADAAAQLAVARERHEASRRARAGRRGPRGSRSPGRTCRRWPSARSGSEPRPGSRRAACAPG